MDLLKNWISKSVNHKPGCQHHNAERYNRIFADLTNKFGHGSQDLDSMIAYDRVDVNGKCGILYLVYEIGDRYEIIEKRVDSTKKINYSAGEKHEVIYSGQEVDTIAEVMDIISGISDRDTILSGIPSKLSFKNDSLNHNPVFTLANILLNNPDDEFRSSKDFFDANNGKNTFFVDLLNDSVMIEKLSKISQNKWFDPTMITYKNCRESYEKEHLDY